MAKNSAKTKTTYISNQPLSAQELRLQGSMFFDLFMLTRDLDCTLMLLEMVGELGDRCEIPLVETYLNHKDCKVREMASEVLKKLR